jgi:hypothetical protein
MRPRRQWRGLSRVEFPGPFVLLLCSFTDDFDEGALFAKAVEFAIENLLPWAEVEFAPGDGDDDFAAHEGAFEVSVGIVLGAIVVVLAVGFFGSELFQPAFEIAVEAGFVVIDEDARGDVHGVDEAQPIANATFAHGAGDIRRDIEQLAALGDIEPEFFAVRFHGMGKTAG